MSDLVLDGFGGPGGWDEALRMLGLRSIGIERDATACATRAAAGHLTIHADMSAFPVEGLARKTWGQCHSPPCIVFSMAGLGAGLGVIAILADGIRDQFAGQATRARRRREMVTTLRLAGWLGGSPTPQMTAEAWRRKRQQAWKRKLLARRNSPHKRLRDMASAPPGSHLTRAQRSAKIWDAVRSASLVLEPARFIYAGQPEWVALEQVPAVLPLWQVYADELQKAGYSTWCGKLNAADYGVPQTRQRAILIASRSRPVSCPPPVHYDPRGGEQLWGTPWVSMEKVLGWGATGRPAPTVTAGGTATGGAEPFGHRDRDALAAAQRAGQWVFRNNNNNNNACTRSLDEPAGTLFFGGRSNWAAWVHEPGPGELRAEPVRITVQEAAVLQSFPPDYPWRGSQTKQFQQVGNAMPPLLAQHVITMAAGIQRQATPAQLQETAA